MNFPENSLKKIHKYFIGTGESLCVTESCTGGLLSFWLTHLPDSSKYFKGALVAYREEVKIAQLGLDPAKIKKEGLVTRECALSMAHGVKELLKTDWSVSITGIAGPSKGSLDESVGKVAFSVVSGSIKKSSLEHFKDSNRKDIRHQAALFALDFLLSELK